ncbi:cell division protein ZipA [Neptunomonas sp.]|uniref:cell division protein ZipA n=1 Tax=Neptunomonas sp. TaxID=1971898 RepID=UPI0025DBA9A6|nr:cell division protein ZipA [Neptunomonas sp.]
MDIGLREWLIIGGLLVIGLIIFDGWRRMKGQRNTLKIDIDRGFVDSVETDVASGAHNPELPNGGARALPEEGREQSYGHEASVASHSSERIDPGFEHLNDYVEPSAYATGGTEVDSAQVVDSKQEYLSSDQDLDLSPKEHHENTRYEQVPNASSEYKHQQISQTSINTSNQQEELDPLFDEIPEILSPVRKQEVVSNAHSSSAPTEYLDLEQPITVLMRQASENISKSETSQAQEEMFFYPDAQESVENVEEPSLETASEPQEKYEGISSVEQVVTEKEPISDQSFLQHEVSDDTPQGTNDVIPESISIEQDDLVEPEQDSLFENDRLESARSDRKAREQAPEPEEVLVITVVGKQQPLDGQTLLQVVLACGMRFGDMSLFHRFEEGIDKGAVQFSMANAVNPGTFDLENMSEMTTPGVSFFMSMSEPEDAKNAFECMLATAETVSTHLGGDLLDENRSVMRPQTKAHYRERIREFEMHKLHKRNLS